MSLYYFSLLSPLIEFYWVLKHDTFLAQRWIADDEGVNLYHVGGTGKGFFVEVCVDNGNGRSVVLRSFVSEVPLEDYSHYIRLPEVWV
jgi:hypothetical protein